MTIPNEDKDLQVGQESTAKDRSEVVIEHEPATAPEVTGEASAAETQIAPEVAAVRTDTGSDVKMAGVVDQAHDIRKLGQPEDMTFEGLYNKTQKRLKELLQDVARLKGLAEKGDVEGLKKDRAVLLEMIGEFVDMGRDFNPDDFTFAENPLKMSETEAEKMQRESKGSYHLQHNDWMMAKINELLNLNELSAAQRNDLVRICKVLLTHAEKHLSWKIKASHDYGRWDLHNEDLKYLFRLLPQDFPMYHDLASNMDVHCYQIEGRKGKPKIETLFPLSRFASMQKFEQFALNAVKTALENTNPYLQKQIHNELMDVSSILNDCDYDSLKKFEQKVDEMADDVKECRAPIFKKIKSILFQCTSLKKLEEKYEKRLVDTKEVLLECGYASFEELKQKVDKIKRLAPGLDGEFGDEERHLVNLYQVDMALSTLLEPLYRAMRKRGYPHREICSWNGIDWNC